MKEIKGAVFVIISAVIFGCMPMVAKYIYAEGCNSASLTVYRYGLSLPILLQLAYREQVGRKAGAQRRIAAGNSLTAGNSRRDIFRKNMHIHPLQFKQFVILSLGFCMTPLLLFASYNYIPSGSATTIHFSYPVFVILASVFIFKEKASVTKMTAVVFCIIGLVLFYEPGQAGGSVGILLALASGITFTFYIMFFDRSILKFMKPFKTNFYLSLISAVLVLAFSLVTGSFVLLRTPESWGLALGFSIMVSVVACVLFQLGIALVGAQKTAVLSTFEPITSIVIGVLCFNEKVGIKTGLGVLFILAAVLLITFFDNKKPAAL